MRLCVLFRACGRSNRLCIYKDIRAKENAWNKVAIEVRN